MEKKSIIVDDLEERSEISEDEPDEEYVDDDFEAESGGSEVDFAKVSIS